MPQMAMRRRKNFIRRIPRMFASRTETVHRAVLERHYELFKKHWNVLHETFQCFASNIGKIFKNLWEVPGKPF